MVNFHGCYAAMLDEPKVYQPMKDRDSTIFTNKITIENKHKIRIPQQDPNSQRFQSQVPHAVLEAWRYKSSYLQILNSTASYAIQSAAILCERNLGWF